MTGGLSAGGNTANGDDTLVITQDAVDTIVAAYERFADELEHLAKDFKRTYSREPWGTLPSIEQLRAGYQDLAIGPDGSAYARMLEFAAEARRIAAWVRTESDAIMATDAATATALDSVLPDAPAPDGTASNDTAAR